MVLKPYEAKKFCDRFGKKQDSQRFYEDKALVDRLTESERWFIVTLIR
jgi:hypothetical protein